MHYGMPTLIELNGLQENMKMCKALGLDFLELNMNMPEFQIEALLDQNISKLKEEYGIDLTLHLPENLYFADFNAHMRTAAHEIFKEAAEYAAKNHIDLLNMHMHLGTFVKLPDEKVYLQEAYKTKYLQYVGEFKDLVDECLSGTNIKLSIENAGDFHHEFIAEAVKVLLDSEHVCLTWDTGHNAKAKYKDQVLLFKNADRIGHVHLHDCAFGSDHLPLGTGEICIDSVMNRLGDANTSIVLEAKTVEGIRRSIIHLDVRSKLIAV